jgi:hypothetical protein
MKKQIAFKEEIKRVVKIVEEPEPQNNNDFDSESIDWDLAGGNLFRSKGYGRRKSIWSL